MNKRCVQGVHRQNDIGNAQLAYGFMHDAKQSTPTKLNCRVIGDANYLNLITNGKRSMLTRCTSATYPMHTQADPLPIGRTGAMRLLGCPPTGGLVLVLLGLLLPLAVAACASTTGFLHPSSASSSAPLSSASGKGYVSGHR